jgi:diguanylate cyclase (GGDEF)-like protein
MNSIINKITNIDLFRFFSNGNVFFKDLELIRLYLIIPQKKSKSTNETHEFIVDAFSKLNDQAAADIKLYGANPQNIEEWLDLIGNNELASEDAAYIAKNFKDIFKDPVQLNHHIFSYDKKLRMIKRDFISFRLNQELYYILYINSWRYQEFYKHIFYTAIFNLINSFDEERERHKLIQRLESVESVLAERERSLQIAERAVKRKVYDLHNLVEASNEIYSILDFKQLINSALLTIIGQIGIQSAFALMYDSNNHAYDRCFQKGYKEKEIKNLTFNIESQIAKFFLSHDSPLFLKDIAKEEGFSRYITKLKKLNVSIVAPIIHAERLQGIIAIGEKLYGRNFSQTDFELFHVLVNIISISIGNALNYEEVKNLSLTDGMTGLHNYRYFAIRLKEELNRARRNKTRVSLLILDIDHFKNYNDTLGHQAGDEALRALGKVLKNTVRDEDVVSRYGGEEFCIILPGSSKESMRKLGERVRRMIEDFNFYKERVQPTGKLTVSLGGSTFPDDTEDLEILVQRADEALYHAKNLGRNQLRLYQKLVKGKSKVN